MREKYRKENTPSKTNSNVKIFDKGDGQRGLVALKPFNPSDTLIVEKPVLWLGLSEDLYNEGLPWALTRKLLTELPDIFRFIKKNCTFRDNLTIPTETLSDRYTIEKISSKSGYSTGEVRKAYNLIVTYNIRNALAIQIGQTILAMERISLFQKLSLSNHSCTPNSKQMEYDTIEKFKRNETRLVATRQIKEGDEITWSYIGPTVTRNVRERQEALYHSFGFLCTCCLCKKESPE